MWNLFLPSTHLPHMGRVWQVRKCIDECLAKGHQCCDRDSNPVPRGSLSGNLTTTPLSTTKSKDPDKDNYDNTCRLCISVHTEILLNIDQRIRGCFLVKTEPLCSYLIAF